MLKTSISEETHSEEAGQTLYFIHKPSANNPDCTNSNFMQVLFALGISSFKLDKLSRNELILQRFSIICLVFSSYSMIGWIKDFK